MICFSAIHTCGFVGNSMYQILRWYPVPYDVLKVGLNGLKFDLKLVVIVNKAHFKLDGILIFDTVNFLQNGRCE